MADEERTTSNIPMGLAHQIDLIIKQQKYGFKSRDEFVRQAVREKLARFNE